MSCPAVANRAGFAATCPVIAQPAREALSRMSFTGLLRYNPVDANPRPAK
jgi:hypothetical protein